MKPKILVTGSREESSAAQATLDEIAEVHYIPREPTSIERMAEGIKRAVKEHGPFIGYAELYHPGCRFLRWSEELLGTLSPDCRIAAGPGAGFDHMDLSWLAEHHMTACNTPQAPGRVTADGALMLILAVFRGMVRQDMSARAGKWLDVTVGPIDWRGRTLGLFGMGNLGMHVAQMCGALGMKIIYHNRRPRTDVSKEYEYVDQEALWKRADCVVLTAPLTEETRHIINVATLAKMKEGVLLVNVARGPLIHEEALVGALGSGQVKRAAIDVFEHEPTISPGLMENANVILSPHAVFLTDTLPRLMNEDVIQNVVAYLKTGRPNTPVYEAS